VASLAFAVGGGFIFAMRIAILTAAALLTATAASAQVSRLDDTSLGGGDRYDNCLLLIRNNPQASLNAASDWEAKGGGGAAIHCEALSLVALHRYAEAAGRLDTLARTTNDSSGRAELYDQAGNAWLLARRPDSAVNSFTVAITFKPRDADLYADRARAYALKPDWISADNDLTAALAAAPNRGDLLVLRASARHAMGKKTDARADVDQALALNSGNVDALELRGEMKAEVGDQIGAQTDWKAVMAQAPRSAAAKDAQDHLNALSQPAPTPAAPPPKK
jgi:tetratricopeptide (TPR) repeat protein